MISLFKWYVWNCIGCLFMMYIFFMNPQHPICLLLQEIFLIAGVLLAAILIIYRVEVWMKK